MTLHIVVASQIAEKVHGCVYHLIEKETNLFNALSRKKRQRINEKTTKNVTWILQWVLSLAVSVPMVIVWGMISDLLRDTF